MENSQRYQKRYLASFPSVWLFIQEMPFSHILIDTFFNGLLDKALNQDILNSRRKEFLIFKKISIQTLFSNRNRFNLIFCVT